MWGEANEKHICVFVCIGVFLCFLDNLKWSSETAHGDVHALCFVCVYFNVFVYLSWCPPPEPRDYCVSICFLDNLKRSRETAHGNVGGLTACHVEVRTANFAWRFSQKKISKVLSYFILARKTSI